jgi:hypothetical protein
MLLRQLSWGLAPLHFHLLLLHLRLSTAAQLQWVTAGLVLLPWVTRRAAAGCL